VKKLQCFSPLFLSQNPSEKFETKFMTFSARLIPIFHASFAENDGEKCKPFFITIFTWNKSVKSVNNLLEKMV
jgi:hypothetical protein